MCAQRMYLYPTRVAFRYHFEEPPNAPSLHQENQRVRGYLSDRTGYKSYNQEPKMSERAELDYKMAPDIVRKDAPFGTTDTPNITMKIIGGRQVPVIEKHPVYNDQYMGSRIQPLQPIADKPNHLDPRTYGDMPGGYYNRDVQAELSPRPTAFVNKRPDSKDVSRGQYKSLPPIQQNRTRNDMSTVFEVEPWITDNSKPPLARETEYVQNYNPLMDQERMDNHHNHHHGSHQGYIPVSDQEKNNLFMLVPRNVLLPVDPIKLSREQESTLCKLICNELDQFDPRELRDVYVECSQHDKELRGCCEIDVVDNSLRRHKAILTDPLRLVAAQFVEPSGKVNYEKILSFIGSALAMKDKGQLSDRPKYYLQNGETVQTGSIYRDREVAKLLRMVEQELSKNSYSMDWTKWQNCFYERDRDHRETLSAAQIKDICYDQKLPLSDSLLNHILTLCEDNNRDGQYRWHAFMEFLSRVRPSNTGLPIPVSKRPLEYAKHYPEPVPNWPRTDDDTHENRGTSPRREPPYRNREQRRDDGGRGRGDFEQRRMDNGFQQTEQRVKSPEKRSPSPKEEKEKRDVEDSGYTPSWQQYNSPRRSESPRRMVDYREVPPRDDPRHYRVPSRYDRPRSYAEPQREVEAHFGRPLFREQTPVRRNRSLSPIRYPSPVRGQQYPYTYREPYRESNPYDYYENYDHRYGGDYQRRDTYREGRGYRGEDQRFNREEQIRQLSNQLKSLETKYHITREGMSSNELPWLDRYLKMAQALYNSDISSKGSLPRKDVMEIVRQYNDAFNLNIDMVKVNMAAIAPENLDKSGNILLRPFLANLSADRSY